MKRPIQVTRSNKPSMFKYFFYSLQMFRSRQFTNSGKFEKKLETKLSLRFNCPHVILMANGTLPLIFLLSQLPKGSTVLTTPFSFIATTSSAMFSGLSVEYVDIDPITLMPSGGAVQDILESKAISAILITQVYGRNEGIREIEAIAKEFDVPFYVDASHSFDVYDDLGTSIYTVGDAATSSFHATKLFSTAEGGAIFTRSPEIARKAQIWKNFGFDNGGISSIGVNAKMSELSAIFGLASIGKVDREMARRKRLVKTYKNSIGIDKVEFVNSPNNSYFPVIFPSHEKMNTIINQLNAFQIFPRRYFHPSLDTVTLSLGLTDGICPVSQNIAERILCLPIGDDVSTRTVKLISRVINNEF